MSTLDQTRGCILGLSLGDALGAPFEGGLIERALWRMIGSTRLREMRWTDDTQMSIDIIESFLAMGTIHPDDLAVRFSQSYRWSRGYGPGAARVLKRIAAGANWRTANQSVYPSGSFGNGAAMRAPIIGLIYAHQPAGLIGAAELSAVVTHAHPIGVEGAVMLAQATRCALLGIPMSNILDQVTACVSPDFFASRLAIARKWLECGDEIPSTEVVRKLGNGIAAEKSCVTAVYLGLRFRDDSFVGLQKFVARVGGDTDTIGAMSGAIWGAANGYSHLPSQLLGTLEQRERLVNLATALHQRINQQGTDGLANVEFDA
jgi:poly(ADP-ribose) glycohydrolase ARH3